MKPLAFVLLVISLHLAVASMAASRHLIRTSSHVAALGFDRVR